MFFSHHPELRSTLTLQSTSQSSNPGSPLALCHSKAYRQKTSSTITQDACLSSHLRTGSVCLDRYRTSTPRCHGSSCSFCYARPASRWNSRGGHFRAQEAAANSSSNSLPSSSPCTSSGPSSSSRKSILSSRLLSLHRPMRTITNKIFQVPVPVPAPVPAPAPIPVSTFSLIAL